MTSVRGESERAHRSLEREMVDGKSSREYGEDGSTILVDCEKELAIRSQIEMGDIPSVCEWEGVAGVPAICGQL